MTDSCHNEGNCTATVATENSFSQQAETLQLLAAQVYLNTNSTIPLCAARVMRS